MRQMFGIIDRGDGEMHTAFRTVDETAVMLGAEGYKGLESYKMG